MFLYFVYFVISDYIFTNLVPKFSKNLISISCNQWFGKNKNSCL